MASWGVFESYRREAEKLKAEREVTPQVTKTVSAPGSVEWLAEHGKAALSYAPAPPPELGPTFLAKTFGAQGATSVLTVTKSA